MCLPTASSQVSRKMRQSRRQISCLIFLYSLLVTFTQLLDLLSDSPEVFIGISPEKYRFQILNFRCQASKGIATWKLQASRSLAGSYLIPFGSLRDNLTIRELNPQLGDELSCYSSRSSLVSINLPGGNGELHLLELSVCYVNKWQLLAMANRQFQSYTDQVTK